MSAVKDIKVDVALDAIQPSPVPVLPELPVPPTGQGRLAIIVTGNPNGIFIKMAGQQLVVEFEISVKDWFNAVVDFHRFQPVLYATEQLLLGDAVDDFDIQHGGQIARL